MLEKFVNRIVAMAEPNIENFDDREYTDKPLTLIKEPVPEPIQMSTLSSLVEYVKTGIDKSPGKIIQIISPTSVKLLSELNDLQQRKEYVEVSYDMPCFPFGDCLQVEQFIIGLQSKFINSEGDFAEVLKVVGNIKEDKIATMRDDGVSQKVVVATGIENVENEIVPNPVTLQPFRTFPDVEQPASQFVLRMFSGFMCALFEADGEQWKIKAMANIKKWLEDQFTDTLDSPAILA